MHHIPVAVQCLAILLLSAAVALHIWSTETLGKVRVNAHKQANASSVMQEIIGIYFQAEIH